MNFKQLDMAGFKSFADKIEIKFNSGVTAIVGPNGCGKSNVADAIRWVLGEQSSKNLRGSSMQDVIFNGTEKRKSLSYCEVTMYFDNSDRFFNFGYDEIAITRKLYRSGESEYLINKTPCRLKDITNLLYSSGLGKDGYSIIGQDQVGKILSSKPEDRRAIFEDAAGISKFKSRKVEAERKLERTKDNLLKIQLVVDEIERQLGPLQKQAEDAKVYLKLKEDLKLLEINSFIYQQENANDVKSKINQKLNAIAEELALRQEELKNVTEQYSSSMESIDVIDKTIERLHESILDLTVSLEKQAGETNVIKERVKFLTEQNSKQELNKANAEKFIEEVLKEIEKKKAEKDEISNNLKIAKNEEEILSNKYLMIIDELALSEGEAEKGQKDVIDALDKLGSIKANASRLLAEKQASIESVNEIEIRLNDLNAKKEATNKNIEEINNSLQNLNKENDEKKDILLKAKFAISALEEDVENLAKSRSDNSTKIQVYENRKRILEEMQAEHEGYAGSVKKLLKESERNEGFKKYIVGTLASLISVPEKFETAIETALGNAVQNIVTKDEQDAKYLIEYLKRNEFGRATFLPITSMRPRALNDQDKKYLSENGCFGVAKDLIKYPSEIESVVSNLLGATVVVANLDNAIKLAQNTKFAYKIVTLDGDIINPQGSMAGGSKKSEAVNLISRDREIKTLAAEIEKLKQDLEQSQDEFKNKKGKLADEQSKYDFLFSQEKKIEVEIAGVSEKLAYEESMLNSFNEEIKNLTNNKTILNGKIAAIEKELNSEAELENALSKGKSNANELAEERSVKFAKLKEEREKYNKDVNEKRLLIGKLENDIATKDAEIEMLSKQHSEFVYDLELAKDEIASNLRFIEQANQMIAEKVEESSSEDSKNKLLSFKEEQQNLEKNKIELQASLKELDQKRTFLIEETNKISEKKMMEEMKADRVDSDIDVLRDRIKEEYSLEYEDCLNYKKEDFNLQKGLLEISKIKKEILKLGYINVSAIEGSSILNERYEGLKAQADDLTKAQNELITIIEEVSSEMKNKFLDQFNKINDNFQQTFRELFGGGNARLELIGSDNVLEAGVEIFAEPPGKKLQSNTLLSGGEKALTAIAILFAILKLKPMPFVLLDEIEAPLDEANVVRFAQYLKRFSKETQFIVITHKKPTMELADSLYGVTMEEKGVSKTVSVKLSEAVKNVEEN
ncbi:MAG: chromosome segregation protein SMC [Clostridia bacterium]|nr:chromosome segregation protein SMC [Clostridia bacterium]